MNNRFKTGDQQILCYLGQLPKKMLQLHNTNYLTEYLLYDLCHDKCFNLEKAAYFVDNPDFNCLKGVAGYSRDEVAKFSPHIWQSHELFGQSLENSHFNKKVRDTMIHSIKKDRDHDEEIAHELGEKIGLSKPHYCSWDMKHDNHGFFLYQPQDEAPSKECVLAGVCFLSFCPIY